MEVRGESPLQCHGVLDILPSNTLRVLHTASSYTKSWQQQGNGIPFIGLLVVGMLWLSGGSELKVEYYGKPTPRQYEAAEEMLRRQEAGHHLKLFYGIGSKSTKSFSQTPPSSTYTGCPCYFK
eukprot:432016-Amphidinium_carterae.1